MLDYQPTIFSSPLSPLLIGPLSVRTDREDIYFVFRSDGANLRTTEYYWPEGLPGIDVIYVGGTETRGSGRIQATAANSLRWAESGDTFGPVVAILNGETKQLPSGSRNSYLIVQRTSTATLAGTWPIETAPVMGNALGFDLWTIGGATTQSARITINNCTTLGTVRPRIPRVAGTAKITGSPAHTAVPATTGTLTIAAGNANTFETWPAFGYVLLSASDDTVHELAYFRKTDARNITIVQRQMSGTAGRTAATTDVLRCVAGVAFQLVEEGASAGADYYAIPDDVADDSNVDEIISSYSTLDLLVTKSIPAAADLTPSVPDHIINIAINGDASIDSYERNYTLIGINRGVRNTSVAGFLYGINEDGTLDTDFTRFAASLPVTVDETDDGDPLIDADYQVGIRRRNSFGQVSADASVVQFDFGDLDAVVGDVEFQATATIRGWKLYLQILAFPPFSIDSVESPAIDTLSIEVSQATSGSPDITDIDVTPNNSAGYYFADAVITLKDLTALATQTGAVTLTITADGYSGSAVVNLTAPGPAEDSGNVSAWGGASAIT